MKQIFTIAFLAIIHHAFQAQTIEAELLGTWSDSTLVGSFVYNNTYNEVWGLVNNGEEYAVIGSTFGTHILHVADDGTPTEVTRIPGGSMGGQIIHRDYHHLDNYLYAVADEGFESTLQIIDYSFLPDSVHIVYDSKSLLRRSHNIFIDSSTQIMYGCISAGDIAPATPLRLFDISDPANPQILTSYSKFGNIQISQVHDMYIKNDTAYLHCGPGGFIIADFTDPMNATLVASYNSSVFPGGYNHSGWLAEDGNHYFMANENWGAPIEVLDLSDLPEIKLDTTLSTESAFPNSIAHNQIVHEGFLYTSYYYEGLQVWDINDMDNIRRVVNYPTSMIEPRQSYEGAWGVFPFLPSGKILISDMQEGLFVVQMPVDITSTQPGPVVSNSWKFMPNPCSHQINIMPSESTFGASDRFTIFNNAGIPVKSIKGYGQHNVDLPAGLYYIRKESTAISEAKKLMIAK